MKDKVEDKVKYRVKDGLVFLNFRRRVVHGVEEKFFDPNKSVLAGGKILASMDDLEGQVHKVTRVHPIAVYCQKCGNKFDTVEVLPENAVCNECKNKGARVDKKRRRIDAEPIKDRMDREESEVRPDTTGEPGVEVIEDTQEEPKETKANKETKPKRGECLVKCNDCGHEFYTKPGKGGLPYVHCPECKKRGVTLVK